MVTSTAGSAVEMDVPSGVTVRVLVCVQPTDRRRRQDGLYGMVQERRNAAEELRPVWRLFAWKNSECCGIQKRKKQP